MNCHENWIPNDLLLIDCEVGEKGAILLYLRHIRRGMCFCLCPPVQTWTRRHSEHRQKMFNSSSGMVHRTFARQWPKYSIWEVIDRIICKEINWMKHTWGYPIYVLPAAYLTDMADGDRAGFNPILRIKVKWSCVFFWKSNNIISLLPCKTVAPDSATGHSSNNYLPDFGLIFWVAQPLHPIEFAG